MADIFGNEQNNALSGTSGDDRIYGLGGNDNLKGRLGNDILYGGDGDDSLYGNEGLDFMFGGAGNDTYYFDDLGDVVSEETVAGVDDGGTDRVYATVSYIFGNFIERATLIGTLAADLTGNAAVNSLTGNSAANTLNGGGGKDTLAGGAGGDVFAFGFATAASTDKVTDFAANDLIGITASDYGLSLGGGLFTNALGNLALDAEYFATLSGSGTQGTVFGHGQFLYNTSSRSLMWDADGAGSSFAGISLATFNTGTVITDATFKILGSAPPPVVGNISIGDISISEGNSGTSIATFTVSRTGTAAFSIDYFTSDGSATAGSDYSAIGTTTLSFAAGQAASTISVEITGDTTIEPTENFFINLANATGGTIIDAQGMGTILNDDNPPAVGNLSISDVSISEGNSGTKIATFTVTRTGGTDAFSVDFATANGTATAGSDYVATTGTLVFGAEASKTISVTINGDTAAEANENFFVNLSNVSNGGTIVDAQGVGTITNDDGTGATVVNIFSTSVFGAADPAGLAYVPGQGLFISDSEVDESPFIFANNLFKVQLDGSNPVPYSLWQSGPIVTKEPTGLAYDANLNRLYISDDDARKVFWVDPTNPTVKLGEFTAPAAATDVEDISLNRTTGNLYIVNGTPHTIVESTTSGVQVGPTIVLPSVISDPEAILYDNVNDVFYVGGGFSSSIFKVDHSGNILATITVLSNPIYRNPLGLTTRPQVKALEFAPTSNPNDDPALQSLYVADYGNTHLSAVNSNDGRIFELDVGAPNVLGLLV